MKTKEQKSNTIKEKVTSDSLLHFDFIDLWFISSKMFLVHSFSHTMHMMCINILFLMICCLYPFKNLLFFIFIDLLSFNCGSHLSSCSLKRFVLKASWIVERSKVQQLLLVKRQHFEWLASTILTWYCRIYEPSVSSPSVWPDPCLSIGPKMTMDEAHKGQVNPPAWISSHSEDIQRHRIQAIG